MSGKLSKREIIEKQADIAKQQEELRKNIEDNDAHDRELADALKEAETEEFKSFVTEDFIDVFAAEHLVKPTHHTQKQCSDSEVTDMAHNLSGTNINCMRCFLLTVIENPSSVRGDIQASLVVKFEQKRPVGQEMAKPNQGGDKKK